MKQKVLELCPNTVIHRWNVVIPKNCCHVGHGCPFSESCTRTLHYHHPSLPLILPKHPSMFLPLKFLSPSLLFPFPYAPLPSPPLPSPPCPTPSPLYLLFTSTPVEPPLTSTPNYPVLTNVLLSPSHTAWKEVSCFTSSRRGSTSAKQMQWPTLDSSFLPWTTSTDSRSATST